MVFVTLLARLVHKLALRKHAATTPEGNPLPRTLHASLPEPATRHRRVLVVGDVHGCAAELQRLLDRCHFRPGVDLLVSVGDLVNKGPDSAGALRLVAAAGGVAVRGNHDDAALAAYGDAAAGRPLARARHEWVRDIGEELAGALREMPFSLTLPGYGVTVVHAGMVPGRALAAQALGDLIKMRDVVPAAALEAAAAEPAGEESESEAGAPPAADAASAAAAAAPAFDWAEAVAEAEEAAAAAAANPAPPAPGSSAASTATTAAAAPAALLPQLRAAEKRHPAGRGWASVWRGPGHVLFGHDAGRRLQLERCATGLDGGCVYGGRLYALVLPPLDEAGAPMGGGRAGGLPADAVDLRLGTGLVAQLVSVPASQVWSPPKNKKLPH